MKVWSIFLAILSIIMFGLAILSGINFNSYKLDEDRKAEIISLAQDVAEQFQEKKINDIESFTVDTVEEHSKRIELSKGKDGLVFSVTFLNEKKSHKAEQIQFPANVNEGILKIEIAHPSYCEDSDNYFVFVRIFGIIIFLTFAAIFMWGSVIFWKG